MDDQVVIGYKACKYTFHLYSILSDKIINILVLSAWVSAAFDIFLLNCLGAILSRFLD